MATDCIIPVGGTWNASPKINSILHSGVVGKKNMATDCIILEGGTWNASLQSDNILHSVVVGKKRAWQQIALHQPPD